MNDDEIQRCDDCARFADDSAAVDFLRAEMAKAELSTPEPAKAQEEASAEPQYRLVSVVVVLKVPARPFRHVCEKIARDMAEEPVIVALKKCPMFTNAEVVFCSVTAGASLSVVAAGFDVDSARDDDEKKIY